MKVLFLFQSVQYAVASKRTAPRNLCTLAVQVLVQLLVVCVHIISQGTVELLPTANSPLQVGTLSTSINKAPILYYIVFSSYLQLQTLLKVTNNTVYQLFTQPHQFCSLLRALYDVYCQRRERLQTIRGYYRRSGMYEPTRGDRPQGGKSINRTILAQELSVSLVRGPWMPACEK